MFSVGIVDSVGDIGAVVALIFVVCSLLDAVFIVAFHVGCSFPCYRCCCSCSCASVIIAVKRLLLLLLLMVVVLAYFVGAVVVGNCICQ